MLVFVNTNILLLFLTLILNDMAFNADLTFTDLGGRPIGEHIKVMECDFGFNQQTDITGKPVAKVMGGTINLVLESTDDESIMNWMIATTELKNGLIHFTLRDNKYKKLEFEEGACIQYQESFNYDGSIPMQISLTISANKIRVGTSTYDNEWISSK